jgi:hypothetical protein
VEGDRLVTRVSFDVDPRILSKLRALANRRGVTVDVVVGEFLGAGIRSPRAGRTQHNQAPHSSHGSDPQPVVRPGFGLIDVDYPECTGEPDDGHR